MPEETALDDITAESAKSAEKRAYSSFANLCGFSVLSGGEWWI